jgi:hypothetical protein
MKPSFFSVARRPKWIAGLLVAFIVAGTFAALMQWQFSRTFVAVGVDIELSRFQFQSWRHHSVWYREAMTAW